MLRTVETKLRYTKEEFTRYVTELIAKDMEIKKERLDIYFSVDGVNDPADTFASFPPSYDLSEVTLIYKDQHA